jgi:hypothetical protein
MNSFELWFDGHLLERGFWLYLWEIEAHKRRLFYVGRTGDSSSAHAASPFSRTSRHFDFKANAKSNSITKLLREIGVNPSSCSYRMVAFGPLFSEQATFQHHVEYRDKLAGLEGELARSLKEKGYNVLGIHSPCIELDSEISSIAAQILRCIKEKLLAPRVTQHRFQPNNAR